jgi:hypothetical protein
VGGFNLPAARFLFGCATAGSQFGRKKIEPPCNGKLARIAPERSGRDQGFQFSRNTVLRIGHALDRSGVGTTAGKSPAMPG